MIKYVDENTSRSKIVKVYASARENRWNNSLEIEFNRIYFLCIRCTTYIELKKSRWELRG